MNLVDQLFAEAISTSQTATAATARYVDALGARAQFSTSEDYREHRTAMREAMQVARGIAAAALDAYATARAAQRAEGAIVRAVPRSEEPEALAAWAALEELETARAVEASEASEPVEVPEARALLDDDASDAVARDRRGLAWGLRDAHDGFAGLASWRQLAASVETVEGWILVTGRRVYVEGDPDEMRAELSARAARLAGEAAQ